MKDKLRECAAVPFLVAGVASLGVAIVILIGVDEARAMLADWPDFGRGER